MDKKEPTVEQKPQAPEKKPDERGGIYVESRIKIFDPETQEVYLDGRA